MAAGKKLEKLFTILLFPVYIHVMWIQNDSTLKYFPISNLVKFR